ncbi:MAG: DUF2281 domain-containing protein [Chloroflexi bacterium]|nr:DUF2281 domain-containing protein [Chloroflexota bacterium]
MQVTEKIHKNVQMLPEIFQEEVLDFVEYLLTKSQQEMTRQDELDWSSFSLASAMCGMEDEDTPTYTMDDLKVVFT